MTDDRKLPERDLKQLSRLDLPTFLRVFQIRAARIMWFLGAGASHSAGVKTAGDMIWDFKQKLYCSQKKLPPSAITDIGDPIVRRKLQAHFDALGRFPPANAEDEYSVYFETTYPSPNDRRAYLDGLIATGKPSFGHLALALLMREELCRAVWTTNFDRTVEDAAAKLLGSTGRLVVADLAEPTKLQRAWDESRWPIYGKLHGDYHSEHIKNISAELRTQDAEMRHCFVEACKGQGLAVVGYSGRDASVIHSLEEALDGGRGFPGGLFWFMRSQDEPYPRVVELLARARAFGIDAHFVDAESFDELLSDIVRFLPETSEKALSITDAVRPRLVKAEPRAAVADTPAVRTNALPIVSYPAICRLVNCDIGGWEEIRTAIEQAGANIEAQRIGAGVLAFGRDTDVRRTFEPHGIKTFETHAISPGRLAIETGERSLVRDALFRAVGRRPGLRINRRGHTSLLIADSASIGPETFNVNQVKPVDRVGGTVSGTTIGWNEACAIRLDYRLDTLWLLLGPRVVLDVPEGTSAESVESAREFVRERRARRHNKAANAMLDGWIRLVVGDDPRLRLRAFDISDGIDAEFEIIRVSGFSGISR